ncbi:MAG: tripartite tricarboxylate transporter substrate binding protein [Burkholderiales bacterium]
MNRRFSISRAGGVMVLAAVCLQVSVAFAQAFPAKPVRIMVGLAPGGGTDIISRMVGQKLGVAINQQVVIDNRPGAGGNIAAELVAKAPPDGYTLIVVTASHAVNPSLYKKLGYDPIKDFTPITQLTSQPYLFVVHPSVPVRNVKDYIALSKTRKGGLTYASSGSGLLGHLGMELLMSQGHFPGIHVPYKGAGPALLDTMAGQVDAFFPTIISGLPYAKSGKVRAIGITSTKRSTLLPDVATVAEQGFPNYEVSGWYGMLAPAGLSREVLAVLYGETAKVLRQQDTRDRMAGDGAEPVGNSPEEFGAYLQSETVKWAKVVKLSGATSE